MRHKPKHRPRPAAIWSILGLLLLLPLLFFIRVAFGGGHK